MSAALSADRLLRWEERSLLACFLVSAIGSAYALEQPLLLIPGAVVLVLFPLLRRRQVRVSKRLEGAILAATVLVSIPIGIAAREPAPSLALFLLAAQGIKLLAPREERDRGTSCLVGMVLTGVAASEAVDPPVILLLLGACLSIASFGLLRNLRLHGGGEEAAVPQWSGAPLGGRVVFSQVRFGMLAFVGTVVFFFVCPRIGAKYFANQRASRDRLAGFTDKVGLSDIGRIKRNDRIAFRVEVEEELPFEPFWRGRALDIYDGETWRASPYFAMTRRMLHRQTRQRFVDRRVFPYDPASKPTTMNFYVEPLGTRTLFTLGNARTLTFKQTAPRGTLVRDDLGSIRMRRAYIAPVAYTLETYLPTTPSRILLSEARRFRGRQYCLAMPGHLDVQRLRSYIGRALRDQRVPRDAPPSQRAAALARHLQRHYDYSLVIDDPGEGEPIAEFLYRRRSGHCELFASAHVFMLRAEGIPARLVTGFRGGEFSDWSSTYTVRQRDAHAWVEAQTEQGWQRFDPTPADSRPEGVDSEFQQGIQNLANWLELRWFSLVIAFDAYDQRNFLTKLEGLLAIRLGMEDSPRDALLLTAGVLGGGLFLILGGVGAWLLLRTRRREALAAQAAAPSDEDLARLLEALQTRGYGRSPGETPRELAQRAGPPLGVARPLREWIDGYYARRYGGVGPRTALEPLLKSLAVDKDGPAS